MMKPTKAQLIAASRAGPHLLQSGTAATIDIYVLFDQWSDGTTLDQRAAFAPVFTVDLSRVCDPDAPAPTMSRGRGYRVAGWSGGIAEVVPVARQPWWPAPETVMLRLVGLMTRDTLGLTSISVKIRNGGWIDGEYTVPLLLLAEGARDDIPLGSWNGEPPALEVVPAQPFGRPQSFSLTLAAATDGDTLFLATAPNGVGGRGFGPAAQLAATTVAADDGATVTALATGLWRIDGANGGTCLTFGNLPTRQRPGTAELILVSSRGRSTPFTIKKISANFETPTIQVTPSGPGWVTVQWSAIGANQVVLTSDHAWRSSNGGPFGSVAPAGSATFNLETACTFVVTAYSQSMSRILSATSPVFQPTPDVMQAAAASQMIVPWAGSAAAAPDGWEFCDGSTYTGSDGKQHVSPDLTNRFIIGATETSLGQALPGDPHSHSFGFSVALEAGGAHSHNFPTAWGLDVGTSLSSHTDRNHEYLAASLAKTTTCTNHSHSFDLNATIGTVVSSPRYYALCYITKK